jgi:hypothetical protein
MPLELHWLINAKKPVRMFGSLTEDQIRQIYHETYGDD